MGQAGCSGVAAASSGHTLAVQATLQQVYKPLPWTHIAHCSSSNQQDAQGAKRKWHDNNMIVLLSAATHCRALRSMRARRWMAWPAASWLRWSTPCVQVGAALRSTAVWAPASPPSSDELLPLSD